MIDPVVFVVDDEEAVRQNLELLLRQVGYRVETFASAAEFLSRDRYEGPACLLLDVCLPGMNGLEVQQFLVAEDWRLPIIFISGLSDVPTSVQAMKAGALDFLAKPLNPQDVLQAVKQALTLVRQTLLEQAESTAIKHRLAQLTPREWEVFRHLLTGQLNKQIASDLRISETTVKIHRRRVLHKMQVQSIIELSRLVEQVNGADIMPQRSPAKGRSKRALRPPSKRGHHVPPATRL